MGRVLPLVYGRQRIGCTFISDFFDILAQTVSTGGKDSTTAGTNYYASFAVAVGHGPFDTFNNMYLNGDPVFTSNAKLYAARLSSANNVATYQTKTPHGLSTGDVVVVYYAFQPQFNGEFTITVVSPTQFQYTIPGSILPDVVAKAQNGRRIFCLVELPPIVRGNDDVTTITIPDFGTADIHWGTETQPVNEYLVNASGILHPPYPGICYIVFHQLFLGFNQTSAQNVEVVMQRCPSFAWQSNTDHALTDSNYGDCNPGCIVADMLLNGRYGLGLDANDDVDTASLDAAIEQFYSDGIGLSPSITRPEELRSQFLSLLENVDAAPSLDDCGKLCIVVARPPDEPPTVTFDDMADMPTFTPNDWSAVTNETYLTFIDQDAGWQQDYVLWKDDAGIFGKERAEPQALDRPMVTHNDLATRLAAMFGAINALPKCDGKIQLTWDDELFGALTPGSAFQLQYDLRPALNALYRVVSRTITDPAKPVFEIEVTVDRSYLYTAASSSGGVVAQGNSHQIGGGGNNPPVPPLAPIPNEPPSTIVELPAALCPNSKPAISLIACRGTQSDTAAVLYLGRNYAFNGAAPDSFFPLASITGFAFNGTLTADFPASTPFVAISNPLPAEAGNVGQSGSSGSPGSGFPLAAGLQIQLTGVDLILPDVCDFDALANSVLLFVGDEIMSVAEANMTAAGAFSLTVIRGRFGTPIDDHSNGDSVWIIPLANLKPLQHPHFLAGNDALFKLTIGDQDVSDVDAFDVTFIGNRWPGTKDASGTWTADSTNVTADQN